MLSISGLTTRAGSFELGPVTLDVPAGRVLVVLGPSGAGKSMLLDTIAGFRTARAGHVRLDGRDITAEPAERRRIGVVFQDAALFPHLSVRDNVAFAPTLRGRRGKEHVDDLLGRFGIARLAERAPRSLSGGERQRVALARALAADPEALLLDEPFSALDQPVREELRELLLDTLRAMAVPAIHVTHDRDEALRLADDLAILAGGTLRQVGAAGHLAGHPTDAVTARLLGWSELGPARPDSSGVRVGDLSLDLPGRDHGIAYYRPEEVLVGSPDGPPSPALRVRARVLEVLRTLPLARVRLNTTPPITALVLHRDLDHLPSRPDDAVTVTMPREAVRVIPGEGTRG